MSIVNNFINFLSHNPFYLVVVFLLAFILLYSIIKKLIKVILILILVAILVTGIWFYNNPDKKNIIQLPHTSIPYNHNKNGIDL